MRNGIPDGSIQTYTGRLVTPLQMTPDQLDINDIARSLAMRCRFAGHVAHYYSVAQHSVLMAEWFEGQRRFTAARWALFHDAAEAYLSDVPSPVKRSLIGFREIEDQIMTAVVMRFGLDPDIEPFSVSELDRRIRADEAQALCRFWHPAAFDKPLGIVITSWLPDEAEAQFLRCTQRLGVTT